MSTATKSRVCPNCGTVVPAARSICPVCKLLVSKMDAFDAARKAAEAKGIRWTQVDDGRPPFYRRPGPIAAFLLLMLIGAGVAWYLTRPTPPPPWSRYATSPQAAAREHMELIATGQDDAYLKAYGNLDPSVYDKTNSDEKGEYRQLYHVLYQYLTGEFGENWINTAKFEPDGGNPERVLVKVGPETLHVQVTLMTPKDAMDRGLREHFAVRLIEEFTIDQARQLQSTAAQMGLIKGVAGEGAVRNLNTILGATGRNRHESPMQKKVRLLPILRNPRETVYRTILQTYPLRDDPVMRARLEMIKDDTRYDPQTREGAAQVLNDRVPEGALEAVGIE